MKKYLKLFWRKNSVRKPLRVDMKLFVEKLDCRGNETSAKDQNKVIHSEEDVIPACSVPKAV